MSGFDKKT